MRHVFATMGTMASLELDEDRAGLIADIERIFRDADERFSLYRADSELSRVARGELRLEDASEDLRASYAAAIDWRSRTGGAFTPNRPDGVVDLNGVVKARALAEAADLLDRACAWWSLDVGGDLAVSAADAHGEAWVAGVVDPVDRGALLCAIRILAPRRAVATSGSAERGDHIWWDGATPELEFVQATVVADDIVTADVLATAIIAGGRATLDELTERFAIDVLTVDRAGGLAATPGFRAALAVSVRA
jgi:thiamine biosynthesis lipoprotein